MIAGSRDAVSHPIGSGSVIACALAYYLLACILLVFGGPSLAALHAFAAFIALTVVAASNQLIPVLTGVAPRPPGEVVSVSIPLIVGFALLIAGFSSGHTFLAAGVLLGLGAIAWFLWMSVRLLRVKLEKAMAVIFILALGAFAIAAIIGGGMAAALGSGRSVTLLSLAPVHAALALGAFATTMIVAISYRFVPMFSLSHLTLRAFEKLPQWIVPVAVFGGCLFFAKFGIGSLRVASGVVFLALAVAAVTHLNTLRVRMRRRLDASTRYAGLAWAFGLIATALFALWADSPLISTAALTFAVLGWISLSILAYAYKIVGFLVWEFAKSRAPQALLPPLSKALPERATVVALWLLGIGTTLTAALASTPYPIIFGTAIYLAGAACASGAIVTLATTYLRIPRVAHST